MAVPSAKETNDETFIRNFTELLNDFNAICNLPVTDKIKTTINEIKEKLTHVPLSMRQSEAIHARCNNYLSGNYGKDAVKDSYLKTNKA